MRSIICTFVFLLPGLLLADDAKKDDAKAKPLTIKEAAKKVGEKVTLEMEVKSVGGNSNVYLNSDEDYRSDGNFTIFIAAEIADKLKELGIKDPVATYKGKKVEVTGTIKLYREKPQMVLEDPKLIKVVEPKK